MWITQENDTQDVVLRSGDTWMVERNGFTIIEAQNDATICATGPRFRHARCATRRAAGAARTANSGAACANVLREWYSLTPRRPIPHV